LYVFFFNANVFGARSVSVDKLRIKKQLNGWIEENGSYQVINTKNLFEIINGGAPAYIDNGMKKGIYQRLMTTDSTMAIELFAEDFGSAEMAEKMFNDKSTANVSESAEDQNPEGRIINKIVGGFWCCQVIEQYYFELTLTGVTDKEKVVAELDKVMGFYQKVIKGGN